MSSFKQWRWFLGGLAAIGIGLAVWPTTFILVPVGVISLFVGVVRSIRHPVHEWEG